MGDIDDINDMSTINGKPVDATANLRIHLILDLKECKASIEKVFGIFLKESNVVLKFHLIFLYALSPGNEPTGKFDYKCKLMYLSEDPIDCKIVDPKRATKKPKFLQNLTCGNQVYEMTNVGNANSRFGSAQIFISLSLKKASQDLPLLSQISSTFNDESSSDFIVESQGKEFHVHKYILRQRSEYFAGLLRNNCMESENERIVIDDFEPKVVEILLRYLYNGAVCLFLCLTRVHEIIGVIKIADKYNFTELVDAIDSYCAQIYFFCLSFSQRKLYFLIRAMSIVDQTLSPKLAMLIYLWKNSDRSDISDEQWSKLIREYPNFAQRMANVVCRKDYQEWGRQHRTWLLAFEQTDTKIDTPTIINDAAIIVGPLGEMKGAAKCSSIL